MQQPKNRSFKIVTAVALIVAVICLSVAYASLSRNLNITGTADVDKTKWEIGTASDPTGVGNGTVDATLAEGSLNVSITANLKLPGDKYVATVPVKNTGEIAAKLTSITGETASIECNTEVADDKTIVCTNAGNGNPGVKYTITYGGKEIRSDLTGLDTDLAVGATKDIVITVEYDGTATKIPSDTVTVKLPTITFGYSQADPS